MSVAVGGRKPREVNLSKAIVSKNLARFQTLVAVIKDDHAAKRKPRHGHFGTAPTKRAVVIDDNDVVLRDRMGEQRVDFLVHV